MPLPKGLAGAFGGASKKDAKLMSAQMASKVSKKDIQNIDQNVGKMRRGPIARVWGNVVSLGKLVKDPHAGMGAKATAIGALLYLIFPMDAIPDIIPVVGLTDDMAVIATAVASIGSALNKYKK